MGWEGQCCRDSAADHGLCVLEESFESAPCPLLLPHGPSTKSVRSTCAKYKGFYTAYITLVQEVSQSSHLPNRQMS